MQSALNAVSFYKVLITGMLINDTQRLDAMYLAAVQNLHSHLQQNRPKHSHSLACHHLFNYPIGRLMNCWNKENQPQYSGRQ